MRIEVTVVPKSVQFRLEKKPDGKIKIHLRSVPESNKANIELMKEMKKLLGTEVIIISGLKSRRKTLEIQVSEEEFFRIISSNI